MLASKVWRAFGSLRALACAQTSNKHFFQSWQHLWMYCCAGTANNDLKKEGKKKIRQTQGLGTVVSVLAAGARRQQQEAIGSSRASDFQPVHSQTLDSCEEATAADKSVTMCNSNAVELGLLSSMSCMSGHGSTRSCLRSVCSSAFARAELLVVWAKPLLAGLSCVASATASS